MNGLEAPEEIEGPEQENLEQVSPSFRGGYKKPKTIPKLKPKTAEKPGEDLGKRSVGQIAKQALSKIGRAIASSVARLAAAVGWPYLAGCLVIFLIIMLIFGGLMCEAINGYFGGTLPQPAGKDNQHVKNLIAASKQKAKGDTYKFELPNQQDRDFLESGQIDERLAAALDYLVQRHEHIRVSHIVSGYLDTNVNPESGAFHDEQITRNISAHRRGQAADIDEIDYVKEKCNCGNPKPVKVAWQIIGENPYGEVPDALAQIQSPDDMANPDVQAALKKMGVKGLDQADLIAKIKAIPVLAQIKSVYDLTDPDVLAAFNTIGVTGLDNQALQTGLKRMHALQKLYDLNLQDINSLQNPQVQQLFAEVGIPISNEVLQSAAKYQATQTLASITSIDDLQNPDVQNALKTLGIDPNDPAFQDGLKKTLAANTILNWRGDPNDQNFKDALAVYGLTYSDSLQAAVDVYQGINSIYENHEPLLTDATIVAMLDAAGVKTDTPEAQKVLSIYRAGNVILKPGVNFEDPNFWSAIEDVGAAVQGGDQEQNRANTKKVVSKFRSANYIFNYHGDYSDPQFLAALQDVGITLGPDETQALQKYKAATVLSQAAKGQYSVDSQEVKDALKTVGADKLTDPKAQAAARVGDSKNQNDPQTIRDKELLGMNQAAWQTTLQKAQAAKNLLQIRDFGDIGNSQVQTDLQTLGLNDVTLATTINIISSVQTLMTLTPQDVAKSFAKGAMQVLAIDNPGLYQTIGKMGEIYGLSQIHNLMDLQSEENQKALKDIGIKDPQVYEYLGKMGDFQTLAQIRSPLDLTKPEVVQALGDLKIADQNVQQQLGKAGSVYALTQIKEPQDLLQPQNLEALDQLGIIDLNDQLLGQIGAIQTLLQVRDFKDLLNPSSILALNTLGIISLSNPVTAALMAISFLDNMLGGTILGGIFGKCKATTDCYKPTAQANVHKVIGELLQFPYDEGKPDYYRVTQLITYSDARDVTPFSSQLDQLYGADRPQNFGLFAMPETADHIHIGY